MAQVTGNIVKSTGLTPTIPKPQPSGLMATALQNKAAPGGITQQQGNAFASAYKAQNPTPILGTSSSPSLVGQQPAGYSEYAAQHTPTQPNPTDTLSNRGLYGQLIGSGVGKLQQAGQYASDAGKLTEAMQRETRDVMGNPWYSGSVKVGQAANIAQQQGSQLQALAAQQNALTQQGQGYLEGAGKVAPTTQFGVLTDPTTGQPIGGGTPQQAAFQGGQVGASLGLGGDYQKAQGFIAQGQTQVKALNDLISQSGVNINDAPGVTALLQQWANLGTSDPRYQKLQSILGGLNTSYSQVLGQAIDIGQLAKQSGKSIMETINDLNARATASAEALKQVGTGQPSTYQAPAINQTSSTSGGTWNW